MRVDPRAKVEDLPVGMQQRVEILRTLYQGSRILILDEPTALLTPQEVEELYQILERLRAGGGTIVFITHKLREVAAISDRVTVIRRGRTVGTRETARDDRRRAGRADGRPRGLSPGRAPAGAPGRPGAGSRRPDGRRPRRRATRSIGAGLTVRRGEIVGICGVEGNGQTELVEAIAGLRKPGQRPGGAEGRDVTGATRSTLHRAGLSYIPEDRHHRGLVLDFTLTENVLLGNLDAAPFTDADAIDYGRPHAVTARLMEQFDVRAPSAPIPPARSLSGGNQQKLIIARELHRQPECSWRCSRRADSTSARSSSCTSNSCRSGTRARASCSFRSSSTRFSI